MHMWDCCLYVADVLLISCGYRSTRLSNIGIFARVTFKLINSAQVGTVGLLCQLLAYRISWMESKLPVGAFE
jgi:hypothetical protein